MDKVDFEELKKEIGKKSNHLRQLGINFDFASLYPSSMVINFTIINKKRAEKIKKIKNKIKDINDNSR